MTGPVSESSDVEQAIGRLKVMADIQYGATQLDKDIDALLSDYERLTLELEDIKQSYRQSINSPCPDEQHCTCLPALRSEVERLQEAHVTVCRDTSREIERLRGVLVRRGISPAPCDICGHNGPGYHQPDSHACVREADQQRAEARAIREAKPE
jgi:hypothetical protein